MKSDSKWPAIYGESLNFDASTIDKHWLEAIDSGSKTAISIAEESYIPVETVVHAVCCRYFDFGEVHKALSLVKEYLANNSDPILYNLYLKFLLATPGISQQQFRKESLGWNKLFVNEEQSQKDSAFSHIDLNADKRLTVAVLCGYALSTLFEVAFSPLFEAIDRTKFKLILFNIGSMEHVAVEHCFDECIDMPVYSSEAFITGLEKIKADILIDLNGRFRLDNPIDVFLRRLVPIQISYGNMLASYSLSAFHYILTDKYTLLNKDEKYYSEKVFRFKNNVMGTFKLPALPIRQMPRLRPENKDKAFTFGSFNATFKLNDLVLETWCQILLKVPNSRLLLKAGGIGAPRLQQRLIKLVSKYKLDDRITLEEFTPLDKMLERYDTIDLALNTFPYSGGTTTVYALWNGVPSLTLCEDGMVQSGGGEGVLQEVGLDVFVANSCEQYINKAVHFATHPEKLNKIRINMRKRVSDSARFQPKKFAKDFEDGLRFTWQDWLKNAEF